VYKKHYPPALEDDVWRLEKIGKDGAFHKRLSQEGIETVEQFLRLLVMDPQKLRSVSQIMLWMQLRVPLFSEVTFSEYILVLLVHLSFFGPCQ
jgi:hypothetical protein